MGEWGVVRSGEEGRKVVRQAGRLGGERKEIERKGRNGRG